MKNIQFWVVVLATALLSACAGPGEMVKYTTTLPRGEKLTSVMYNQQVPNWFIANDKLAMNYMVLGGDVTPEQLQAVGAIEEHCRVFTKTTNPGTLVAVVSNATLFYLAGYAGVGIGATAFPHKGNKSLDSTYAKYGGAASAAGGAASGLVGTGSDRYTFDNCNSRAMALLSRYGIMAVPKN